MAALASQNPTCPKEVDWLFALNAEALQKDPVSTMTGMAFLGQCCLFRMSLHVGPLIKLEGPPRYFSFQVWSRRSALSFEWMFETNDHAKGIGEQCGWALAKCSQ